MAAPRRTAAACTIRTTARTLPMSWGNRLPCSQAPIVVGDTPAALAKARSEGSPASDPALKTCRASTRVKNSPPRSGGPLSVIILLCPPLSSPPLDTRQRKAATSAIPKPRAETSWTPAWTASLNPSARTTPSGVPRAMGDQMHTVQVLTLLLALSGALNAGFTAGLTARLAGAGPAQAILTGAAAAGTVMAIFFAAVSAYR